MKLLNRLIADLAGIRRSRLFRSALGVGGLTGAELGLGLVSAVLLARMLGADGLGMYALALAVIVIASLPVDFGLPSLILREIAHCVDGHDGSREKAILVFSFTVIATMSAVAVPAILIFGHLFAEALETAEYFLLAFAAFLIPVNSLGKSMGAALGGRQRVVLGLMPQRLVRPGVFVVALALAALLDPDWLGPARAMALQLAASVVALVVCGYHFMRHFRSVLQPGRAPIPWKVWFNATFRLGISSGIHLSQGQVLILITSAFSSIENVGLLRIAQRGGSLAALGTTVAINAVSPRIARLSSEGQTERLQHLLTTVARYTALMAMASLAVYVFAGGWLLETVFGAEFRAAWGALVVLAAMEAVRALIGPGIPLMNMVRHEGTTALGFVLSLAVSTAVAAMLVPAFGAAGAAWGTFFGITAMSLFLWSKARANLGLDTAAFRLPKQHGGEGG